MSSLRSASNAGGPDIDGCRGSPARSIPRQKNLVAMGKHSGMSKELGQYFTTAKSLQAAVAAFCRHPKRSKAPILEPSAGKGDLVELLHHHFPTSPTHSVEIDTKLGPAHTRPGDVWIQDDFLKVSLPKSSYRTIVGNPPYIRKGPANVYLSFIDRCLGILAKDGELVFVLPADFFRLTGSLPLLSRMCEVGAFTDIHWGDSEHLFEGAAVDVVVIRFQKGRRAKGVYTEFPSGKKGRYRIDSGKFEFYAGNPLVGPQIQDIASVHVGLVSGRENVFRKDVEESVEVLIGENDRRRYIMAANEKDPVVKKHLAVSKPELLSRRVRKFDETNWFEWGALRNIKVMKAKAGAECIYIRCLTRLPAPAFTGRVELFGSQLICVIPHDAVALDMNALASYLNDGQFVQAHSREDDSE